MENQSLDEYIKNFKDTYVKKDDSFTRKAWYNPYGDCIEFRSVNEAVVGDRIDCWLTIYRSAQTNEPIGFQLKDVMALVKEFGVEGVAVEYNIDDDKKLVSLTALFIIALLKEKDSIRRRSAYTETIKNLIKVEDEVSLATK